MKESFNTLSNLVNLLSTKLIVDKKIKARQLTVYNCFHILENIHKPFLCLQLTVTYFNYYCFYMFHSATPSSVDYILQSQHNTEMFI